MKKGPKGPFFAAHSRCTFIIEGIEAELKRTSCPIDRGQLVLNRHILIQLVAI